MSARTQTHALGGQLSEYTLANGMRVVLVRDNTVETVAVQLWVASGSAHDPAQGTGMAHLLEHLMFKGAEGQPSGEFDRFLEQHGAHANAATWMDWTAFHEVVLPQQLTQTLTLEAQRFRRLSWNKRAFSLELSVVKNERREQVESRDEELLDEALYRWVYGKAPYGRPIIGEMAHLNKITLDVAQRHHSQHYRPSRTTLVLAGAVPDGVDKTLEGLFGPWTEPATPVEEPASTPLPPLSGKSHVVAVDGHLDRVHMAWRTVAFDHPDHAALTVLAEVIANAESARVERILRDHKRLASEVSAQQIMTQKQGTFELRVGGLPGVKADKIAEVINAALTELVTTKPITAAELHGAKRRLLAARYAELSSVEGRADLAGLFASIGGSATKAVTWLAAVQRVSLADVQRAAATWLVPAHQVTVLGRCAPHVVKERR